MLDAGDAIRACALFDISPNNVRVALNRLLAAGLVETVGRGSYRLGPEGLAVGREVAAWRELEGRLRPWDGAWVVVVSGTQGRGDRKAVRAGDRAMSLLGLRELDAGLHVRPDNLAGSVDVIRERLLALGLSEMTPVFQARAFDVRRELQARKLWEVRALERAYEKTCQRLNASLARLERLPVADAARESWLLGDQAIRQLVFDPLLPEPLISAGARSTFIRRVRDYDEAGFALWQRFLR